MAATLPLSSIENIGEVAGSVWRALSEHGPMSMTKLLKTVDEPRDTVMQAVGWLAREGKLQIDENGRNKSVSLIL
jgi:predicted transcriptional regulator